MHAIIAAAAGGGPHTVISRAPHRVLISDWHLFGKVTTEESAGCYGVCLRCDKTIPSSRLQALPTAILCRDCQEAVEEESLAGCRA